jgi:hypothetical protein
MPDSECGEGAGGLGRSVAVMPGFGSGVFGGTGSALAVTAVSPITAIPNPAARTVLAANCVGLG